MTTVQGPTVTGTVDQKYLIEPLTASKAPILYTDRFPDSLYNKAPEAHWLRLLYTMIGPVGTGWLRKQTFEARLIFEQSGISLFDLDRFYGDPFSFGRIIDEVYTEDPTGVLNKDAWDAIRAKDQKYRARAIDFINGARAGNTPLGIKLVARSGLGDDVEVIENYQYLFDIHSDDPLGLVYFGQSLNTNEVVILPQSDGDQAFEIKPADQHSLISALDKVKPVTAVVTTSEGQGVRLTYEWNGAFASSEYDQVLRYVNGNTSINWPTPNKDFWIVGGVEKEAPRISKDLQYHYQGFHNALSVLAYKDSALADSGYGANSTAVVNHPSVHIGRFNQAQTSLPAFGYLRGVTDDLLIFTADRCLADYPEPLVVSTQTDDETFINGIYPSTYAGLSGVPPVKYKDEQFWASADRLDGTDYLEIDLGSVQAVNYVTFEVSEKPLDIDISYDLLDQAPRRNFIPVVTTGTPTELTYNPEHQNPWSVAEFEFEDRQGQVIYTRFIRIGFTRRAWDLGSPWSIEVRNLRIARNVSNF